MVIIIKKYTYTLTIYHTQKENNPPTEIPPSMTFQKLWFLKMSSPFECGRPASLITLAADPLFNNPAAAADVMMVSFTRVSVNILRASAQSTTMLNKVTQIER